MSEQANTRIVQDIYQAYLRKDIPAVLAKMGDDIVFQVPGPEGIAMAGTYRGRQGMREFFDKLAEELEFTSFEPREFVAERDRVIALGHYRGIVRRTGNSFAADWAMAWTIRDGKAVRFQEYTDTEAVAGAYRGERRMAV